MQTFKTSRSKENILSRIRKGLSEQALTIPFPEAEKETESSIFTQKELPVEEVFAESFIQLGGKFVFCDNEQELLENVYALYENRGWQKLLCSDKRLFQLFLNNKLNMIHAADPAIESADACITDCELLIARTGSVLLSSRQYLGRTSSIFYPVHIIVAYASQVVPDINMGMKTLQKKYGTDLPSMINLNTGPSRTADIEKTLIVGVHGPAEVFCFYVNA
jgi:L-lactate dehydrogenase complex protein LldG